MPRYFVENKGEWNIFSTIVDDFLFDEFICLDALKARLLYEEYKRIDEDINSLLTDRPKVNVMPYEETLELIRKDEPTISKMEQVDEPQTNADQHVQHIGSVESVEPTWTKEEHEAFYTFLWNVINPNEMQDYIEMFETKDEPRAETEIARAIVHKMIDDAVIAEDAYPDLRQKMHDAVDEYEPQTDCAWR